jgi:AraC-like DNA-binding protein
LKFLVFREVLMFRSGDQGVSLDDEKRHLEGVFNPFAITALSGGAARAKMRYARYGPVVFCDVTHMTDVDVAMESVRTGYHLLLPLNGHVTTRYLGRDIVATPGTAVLYRAHEDVSTHLGAGVRMANARFDLSYVNRALESQIGDRLTAQIDFPPLIEQANPQAWGWLRMVLALSHQLSHDSVLLDPLVALPYSESLVQGLLLTTDHPYRRLLDRQGRPGGPVAVRTAIELMEAEAGRPLTSSVLAAAASVSVRTLQESFRRYLGTSPMAYLREIRLRRAHEELRAADPSAATVAAIARRWGFTHMGRFAAAYQAAYGEAPSAALRAARLSRSKIGSAW